MSAPNRFSERERQLLTALVRIHIREGQPVGSRRLVEETGLPISSATVRNIVAELEEKGFVSSPHTSAGRIPTDKGYRFFIDSLAVIQPVMDEEFARLQCQLEPEKSAKELVESASNLLSAFTHQAGLVTIPRREEVVLRQMEFLPLVGGRVLVILVFNEKEVENRIIETGRDYDDQELRTAANFINANFAGKSLQAIRAEQITELKRARSQIDGLMKTVVELAGKTLDHAQDSGDYVMAGQSYLLESASGENMTRLQGLFEAFQHKNDLLHLMERCIRADGIQIFVGEEADFDPLIDFSLVTAPYQSGERTFGVLGVIGPTRMAYERIIPVVDVTARLLSAALRQH